MKSAGIPLAWALLLPLVPVPCMAEAGPNERLGGAGSFLASHCAGCHAGAGAKGKFRIDNLAGLPAAEAAKRWGRIVARLEAGEMPPVGKTRPGEKEVAGALATLKSLLAGEARERRASGRAQVRRLNRLEYENSIHDLLHVRLPLRDLLPEDDSADGFDNGAKALSISPVHVQRYMEAAERALASAIIHGPRPETKKLSVSFGDPAENTYQNLGHAHNMPQIHVREGKVWFLGESHIEVPIHSMLLAAATRAAPGRYRVTIATHTEDEMNEPLTLYLKARHSRHEFGYFDSPLGKPAEVVIEHDFKPGDSVVMAPYNLRAIRRSRGLPNPGLSMKAQGGPALVIDSFAAEGPLHEAWPPASHEALFASVPMKAWKDMPKNARVPLGRKPTDLTPAPSDPSAEAKTLLGRFLPRAFRRPLVAAEMAPYLALVERNLSAGESFESAMLAAYQAALCSPDFLFLIENPGPLDHHALASRLSYFLTRSMPDETLRSAADAKLLGDPAVLRREASRLLDSPRSLAFLNDFLDQWLRLRDLDATMPDKELFPEFYEDLHSSKVDGLLRSSIEEETRLFFADLLRNDRGVGLIVDSGHAFLNKRLAEHYGLPPVAGARLRSVKLPAGSDRGGVLTHASILKVTANGSNTSPVTRGAWVLESILGRPPQPPPPDAGGIEPDTRGATTIREQLAKHQASATCANCHRSIDPPGFALEAFDPIGQFRQHYRATKIGTELKTVFAHGHRVKYRQGPPVDASGVLPGGQPFSGPREFKALLARETPFIARNLAAKLAAFATGQHADPGDLLELDRVVAEAARNDFGFRSLVISVIGSDIFRTK